MRILQINTTVNTTSTGRIAEEIGCVLQEHGHESYIACKKIGSQGSQSDTIFIGNRLDGYMHGIKTRILDRHGFGSSKTTQKLVKKIGTINPDVIGLHNLHGYYLNVEVLFNYLKEVQKPVIWTLHDCWPFTGHCSFFDYVSCEKWKTECRDCPLIDKYPASWFVDNSTENFHRKRTLFNGLENLTIVTPSHWLKNLVSQSFLSEYPVKVIPNGIDLKRFIPSKNDIISKYNLAGKKILLGVASVWDRRKGLKDFIALSKCLDDEFKIILIGLSQSQIKGLPENIIGIQRTESIEELVSFYSSADVFLNPTWVDNFPTTNIEALACGTPVITYDTGGSPEALSVGTGIVISKGDIGELHSAVKEIVNSRSLYKSPRCRKRAEKHFDKNDRYENYLALYERAVKKMQEKKYYVEKNQA